MECPALSVYAAFILLRSPTSNLQDTFMVMCYNSLLPCFISLFLQAGMNKEVIISQPTIGPDIHIQDVLYMIYWSISND